MTREAALSGHLTKQGSPSTCLYQFFSCVRSALLKIRNVLMYQHTKLSVDDCAKMGLRELQLYHQKTVGEDGKEVAKTIWQMCHWHRLFEDIASPEEESGDVEEEIEASEEESGSSDNNNENSDSDDGEKDSERIMTFTKN